MAQTSAKIASLVARERGRLQGITEDDASRKPDPQKWSRKEILGHLVDSALNNHQRFVRAQLADSLQMPGYAQNDWVRVQGYGEAEWSSLVDLWCAVNRHIARVVARIPPEKLSTPCRIGEGTPMSLGELVVDYIRHVEHHLAQIE